MATVTENLKSVSVENASASTGDRAKSGFLVGPWFDLLFVCNLYWPLILLIDSWGGLRAHESLLFWQVFFVTTPHRWITLFLVFGDRQKMQQMGGRFYTVAALVVGSVSLLWLSVGSLLCLMAVDYLWNAWHFAAQHHGIYRIYSRKKSEAVSRWLVWEKWLFRLFILYVIARVAGWSWDYQQLTTWATRLDYPLMAIPVTVLASQWIRGARDHWSSLVYTGSVMALFMAMLWAVHEQRAQLVLQLALASALFHAVEYLAIVSWSMRNSKTTSRRDLFGYVGSRWLIYLAAFMIILGASAWMLEQGAFRIWAGINLMVAFLHYSYDGIIWKKPRAKKPEVA